MCNLNFTKGILLALFKDTYFLTDYNQSLHFANDSLLTVPGVIHWLNTLGLINAAAHYNADVAETS